MIRVYLEEKDIWKGNGIKATGLMIKAEAGEAITALDICYIKASDGLAYRLDTGISEVDTCISVMALEGVTINTIGRFMLKGTVEYASWTFTPGNRIIVPAVAGTASEEAEV